MAAPIPLRFNAAARLPGLLLGAAGGALSLALVALAGQVMGYGALAPLAVYMLLLAVVLYSSRRAARLRAEVHRTRDAHAEVEPATEPEGPTPGAWAQANLSRFGREGVATLFSLGGAAGLGLSVVSLRGDLGSGPAGAITAVRRR